MKRKIICLCMLLVLCLVLSSCGMIKITSVNTPDPTPQQSSLTTPTPVRERYTVNFDKNETFPNENYRRAAEHIDPYIKQAVKLMNSVREDRYTFDVLDCDYSKRAKEGDSIKNPVSKEIYDIMVERTFAFEDYHFDNSNYSGDLFNVAVTANDAIRQDYPYLMLYCDMKIQGNSYYSVYYMPGNWINNPCTDRQKVKDRVDLYDCVVSRILDKMPANLSNREKCMYFAFVIASAVEYDDDFETYGNNYQAYDAMVHSKALCEGYSLAFYYLCQQAGISCWYCLGEAPYELGYHAWNMVETADGPVYIDVTWYDEEDITENYRDGKTNYLFMTQEDYDYYGYIETGRK